MIPNDLNPNTFYRSFNDYPQIYGDARSLQGETLFKAIKALSRGIANAVHRLRERLGGHGTPHAPMAS